MKTRIFEITTLFLVALVAPQAALAKKKTPPAPDVPPPVAKSGPSFEETRDWIVTTVDQYGGHNLGSQWVVYSNASIDNLCVLRFDSNWYAGDYKKGSKPFAGNSGSVEIPLGAVTSIGHGQMGFNPNDQTIDLQTGNVAAVTYGGGDNFAGSHNEYDLIVDNSPNAAANMPIPASPQSMVPRLTSAFQHMVDICKGTYQAPAQQKQPF